VNTLNIALAGNLNTGYNFCTPEVYTCVCGSRMLNSYSVRWSHSISYKHLQNVIPLHVKLLSANPAYEYKTISSDQYVYLEDGTKILFIL